MIYWGRLQQPFFFSEN